MKPSEVYQQVKGIPHMDFNQAEEITSFILENKCKTILELGFKHGVSTCYMAGALDELGGGKITTVDLVDAKTAEPNIENLLMKLGLAEFAEIYYEPTSYIWRLMKLIEQNPEPIYDLCYVDGAHDWFVDGFAFFLTDKLLLAGGWILFDDIDWTYGISPALKDTQRVKNMPVEERETRQMRKVYDLLVKPHPNYRNFIVKEGWAYAQKQSIGARIEEPKVEVIYKDIGLIETLKKLYRKVCHS